METTALARVEERGIQPTYAEVERMAAAVAKSGLFSCRTPEAALTLMLLAQAENMHPIQAMRQFHIIENKPSMRADAMLARFRAAGGRHRWVERGDERCIIEVRAGDDEEWQRFTYDLKDAARAGLGGRDNWKKYPRQMLSARVISEAVRATMPEVICGLYTPEEVADFDEPKPKRRVEVAVVEPAPTPEPTPEPPADYPEPPTLDHEGRVAMVRNLALATHGEGFEDYITDVLKKLGKKRNAEFRAIEDVDDADLEAWITKLSKAA